MSFNAASLSLLREKGLSLDDVIEVATAMESTKDNTNAERQRRYRDRRRKTIRPEDWDRVRFEVFERDSYTCTYCGYQGDDVVCDHRVPLIKGGTSDTDNLVTACKPCNSGKAGRTPEEWQQ